MILKKKSRTFAIALGKQRMPIISFDASLAQLARARDL